jgi:hypothetical protein|tara:strand:- start:30 stop:455 length:426 start_codon:yes stop_codon:yes gene_type:complete
MKLSSIIFEGFKEYVSIVNGEKYSVDWLGNADTLQDFQDALKRMPETIEYINIPTDDKLFNPTAKRIKPKGSWKLEVYATVKKVIDMHEKEGNELEGIRISSYYTIGPKGADDHPIYVSIDTKESREFGQAMSRGDYGPLD